VSAKAAIEIRDVIRVWIEFRAPKKGELMWTVPADATAEEALEHVLVGRDNWSAGEAGFGYRAIADQSEFELLDEGDLGFLRYRNLIVHVEHMRTEPKLNNVIPYIKLL
jgi:hypothetical protein